MYINPNTYENVCIFDKSEDVSGEICIMPYELVFEHKGVMLELIGEISK